MPYFNCKLRGGVTPDSITLSGGASATLNPSVARGNSNNPVIYTSGNCTIPSFGYHYADVTGGTINSLSGNNIDISQEDSFEFLITAVYKSSDWTIHYGGSGEYPFGNITAKWTIVLHN